MVIRDEDENLTNYITNGDKDVTACRTCGISRWKVDNKTYKVYENIPAKVKWYFPIRPRLQRLFKIQSISEDLRWHVTRRITDGVLRHPADSQAWRTIDEKFPEIAKDPKNLRLGISADGVDVNTGNRHHSVWPVLTVIYNLPLKLGLIWRNECLSYETRCFAYALCYLWSVVQCNMPNMKLLVLGLSKLVLEEL
ncbi:hypothetical protein Tco_0096625 [Tanacetum coccineum]